MGKLRKIQRTGDEPVSGPSVSFFLADDTDKKGALRLPSIRPTVINYFMDQSKLFRI